MKAIQAPVPVPRIYIVVLHKSWPVPIYNIECWLSEIIFNFVRFKNQITVLCNDLDFTYTMYSLFCMEGR